MRLWTVHPKYLDDVGLARCYNEGIIGLRALEGINKGYANHSELNRFKTSTSPINALKQYLCYVREESARRNIYYKNPIDWGSIVPLSLPTRWSTVNFEVEHLKHKLFDRLFKARSKKTQDNINNALKQLVLDQINNCIELNPLFYVSKEI